MANINLYKGDDLALSLALRRFLEHFKLCDLDKVVNVTMVIYSQ